MSITGILIAAACVGIVGIFVGLFLGVAGIKFKVEVDEKEEAVLAALPGNNCGGCGFAGCSGLAAAIAKGEAAVNTCPVGGEEVGKKIAAIMGVEAEASERKVAYVHCQGDCDRTKTDYDYYGIKDWRILTLNQGFLFLFMGIRHNLIGQKLPVMECLSICMIQNLSPMRRCLPLPRYGCLISIVECRSGSPGSSFPQTPGSSMV